MDLGKKASGRRRGSMDLKELHAEKAMGQRREKVMGLRRDFESRLVERS